MIARELRTTIQKILGVTPDSDFGAKTWAAYRAADNDEIEQIQSLLQAPETKCDGMRGPKTDGLFRELDDYPAESEYSHVVPRESVLIAGTRGSDAMHPALSRSERETLFGGPFKWERRPERGNAENIIILGDWEERNIVTVDIPQLRKVPGNFSRMRWNKRGVEQLKSLWAAWEKAGLLELVLSYEGSFVPRTIRGSTTSLSNHAYGTAFDINYFWNQLGHTPADEGEDGDVHPLVPIAHEHGFYWGGNFARLDGMHFELCVIL